MKNCLLYLLIPILSLGFVTAAVAQDADKTAREAAARKMLKSMDMESGLADSLATGLETQMAQFSKMGMPPEGVGELKEAMLSFMLEVMKWEELEPEFVKIYAENFTVNELEEITAFYQTPIGKKALKLMPKMMAEGMVLGQSKVEARQAELQELITPIIQKHMAPQ